MVAAVAAGQLEECALSGPHGLVVPGEVRGAGVDARGQQRHDRRIVPARPLDAENAGAVDLGDDGVLRHARLGDLEDAAMHRLDDPGRRLHVGELARRLDRALPVHQPRRVPERRARQLAHERRVTGGREVVVVQLDADPPVTPAPVTQDPRKVVHRVPIGRLHVVIRIADDPVVAHVDGASGAVGVLAAAEPMTRCRRRCWR